MSKVGSYECIHDRVWRRNLIAGQAASGVKLAGLFTNGCYREQVKSMPYCKTVIGEAVTARSLQGIGGRPARSSVEAFVMSVERRSRLV